MWHRITLGGSSLESALEQSHLLNRMAGAIMEQSMECYKFARALSPIRIRWKKIPIEVRSNDDNRDRVIWHLNDGALDLYLALEGLESREIEYSLPYVSERNLGGVLIHHHVYVRE